jgi:hypothetical protein
MKSTINPAKIATVIQSKTVSKIIPLPGLQLAICEQHAVWNGSMKQS